MPEEMLQMEVHIREDVITLVSQHEFTDDGEMETVLASIIPKVYRENPQAPRAMLFQAADSLYDLVCVTEAGRFDGLCVLEEHDYERAREIAVAYLTELPGATLH